MKTIIILGLATAAAFCSLCGYVIWDTRQAALEEAYSTNANLVQAISQDISRNFEMFDLSIQGVIDALNEPDIDQVSPAIRQIALFDNAAKATYFNRIVVLNAAGNVSDDSKPSSRVKSDYSDREYFTVHENDADVGLYVSKPLDSRVTPGEWIIALSRRISRPDGSFAGVVVGTLDVNYFEALFGNLRAGPLDRFAVIRTDRTMVMRYPFSLRDIGRELSQSSLFSHFPATRSGTFEDSETGDRLKRFYAFGQVGNLPLIVTVGSAETTIWGSWLSKALLIGALMAILAAAMMALTVCLIRELGRRRRTEEQLKSAAASLAIAASTDGLTGLANRRRFDESAEVEWKRSIRNGEPLSIFVVDVDFFKAYNDAFGHLSGDEALKAVASCVRAALERPADLAARYGGEEFAVLLPDTPGRGALKVAENIRAMIAERNIHHPCGLNERISVSIGITTIIPSSSDSFTCAFNAADEALFCAKRLGRDTVVHKDRTLLLPVEEVRLTPEVESISESLLH